MSGKEREDCNQGLTSAQGEQTMTTRLTEHLRRGDVQLVRHHARESRHEEHEDVDVAVKEGVRPNQEDALGRDLIPHRQGDGDLHSPGKDEPLSSCVGATTRDYTHPEDSLARLEGVVDGKRPEEVWDDGQYPIPKPRRRMSAARPMLATSDPPAEQVRDLDWRPARFPDLTATSSKSASSTITMDSRNAIPVGGQRTNPRPRQHLAPAHQRKSPLTRRT